MWATNKPAERLYILSSSIYLLFAVTPAIRRSSFRELSLVWAAVQLSLESSSAS